MRSIFLAFGLLAAAACLTDISAKDSKKSLEDRIVALEKQVTDITNTLNGPVSDNMNLLDERTLDLNERLRRFESQEDNKVKADILCAAGGCLATHKPDVR